MSNEQVLFTLQWCHNGCHDVSNHRRLDCLANRLFRHRSKKTPLAASLAFARGIHRWPVNSPQEGSITRNIFFIWRRHHVCKNMSEDLLSFALRLFITFVSCVRDLITHIPHGFYSDTKAILLYPKARMTSQSSVSLIYCAVNPLTSNLLFQKKSMSS